MAKSGGLQTTTDDSAAAMHAQDANNASPLKDLASSIPSGGGGGNGVQTLGGSSGLGKIQAFDHTFKMDGGNNSAPSPHVCTTRDEWDSGLSILGGGGEQSPEVPGSSADEHSPGPAQQQNHRQQ
jgi:hypothetical protein